MPLAQSVQFKIILLRLYVCENLQWCKFETSKRRTVLDYKSCQGLMYILSLVPSPPPPNKMNHLLNYKTHKHAQLVNLITVILVFVEWEPV
jgi:hypothetical protein